MPNLPHIIFPRVESEPPRRRGGFGRPPNRDYSQHGPALQQQLDSVVQSFQSRRLPQGVNPNLILRIQLHPNAIVEEGSWERCGLTLLSVEQDKTLVLFSSDEQLLEFRQRLENYKTGPRARDQQNAPYSAIFASIENINDVGPEDRIGRLLRAAGVDAVNDLRAGERYTVDVELWDFGGRDRNVTRVTEIENFVRTRGGEATDRYIGESLVLMRIKVLGEVLREVANFDSVAQIDLPPQPSLAVADMLTRSVQDFPTVREPEAGAAPIAILDSGLAAGHPLLGPAVGEATAIPLALGDGSDAHGHGTLVGGIALYGDVEACISGGRFTPALRLYSARVLNENCKFDDGALITTQMRDSIRYFRETYGCRVFNLSLGDDNLPYRGGKVSPWASVLDTLARELDVVIVASAGNFRYRPREEEPIDACLLRYPRYLLDDEAKVIEPATGAIVLAVGALANSDRLPLGAGQRDVAVRPISQEGEPSPFTRSGPGLGGGIKPELCDFGGNQAYDGRLADIRELSELSVISMNRDYLRRLFATDVGTSYAAPRVAHIAAKLLQAFPEGSANLIRALLISSASVPTQAVERLTGVSADAVLRVCGYGRPDFDRACFSQENRVVLYSDPKWGTTIFMFMKCLFQTNFWKREIPGQLKSRSPTILQFGIVALITLA